jgi:hypothetical protein
LLLALEDGDGVRLFVNPDWRQFVVQEDFEYIETLLPDIRQRAERHPEALFEQLCSLAAGPLTTSEVGSNLADNASLQNLVSLYVRL